MSEDKKITSEEAFEKWLDRSDSLEDALKETKNQTVQSHESAEEDNIWQERLKTALTIEHYTAGSRVISVHADGRDCIQRHCARRPVGNLLHAC